MLVTAIVIFDVEVKTTPKGNLPKREAERLTGMIEGSFGYQGEGDPDVWHVEVLDLVTNGTVTVDRNQRGPRT